MNMDFFKKNPAWFGVLGLVAATVIIFVVMVLPAQSKVAKLQGTIRNKDTNVLMMAEDGDFPSDPRIDSAAAYAGNYEKQLNKIRDFYLANDAGLEKWLTPKQGQMFGDFTATYTDLQSRLAKSMEDAGIGAGYQKKNPLTGQVQRVGGFSWIEPTSGSNANQLRPVLKQIRMKERAAHALVAAQKASGGGIADLEEMRVEGQKSLGEVNAAIDFWPNWNKDVNGTFLLPRGIGEVHRLGVRVTALPGAVPHIVEQLLHQNTEPKMLVLLRGLNVYAAEELPRTEEIEIKEGEEKKKPEQNPLPVRVTVVLDVMDFNTPPKSWTQAVDENGQPMGAAKEDGRWDYVIEAPKMEEEVPE